MARLRTFAEEVVCPAEQIVKIRPDLPFTHRLQCRDRHRRRYPPRAGAGRIERLGYRLRRRRAQYRAGVRLAGANPIIACDLRDNKLEYARSFGATHTIKAASVDVVKQARELTDGLGADTAFDAIGGEATALQAVDAVAPGGRAVLVGIPAFSTRAPINRSQLVYGEKMISGTYYGSVRPNIDFPLLADLDMDRKIDLDSLISRTYRLDEINEGFRLMLDGAVARVIVFD